MHRKTFTPLDHLVLGLSPIMLAVSFLNALGSQPARTLPHTAHLALTALSVAGMFIYTQLGSPSLAR
ncbi:MAG TPA: hypothetical protein VLA04_05235 [Verrucomicrobiae bacterium]|nr:hypothetical protein [Verrucomicrobiae bacterium]